MKTTAFTEKHIALGAKMVPFAGYNMPVEYVGINEEHNTVRNGVGVFDVSHMGEIWVKGPNALAFLQYVSSNDVAALYPGKVQYTCFPNGKGGIVDDYLTYCIDEQTYLLVVNASNIEKDWNHLCAIAPKFGLTPGKELYNASDEICQLAVQGPKAVEAMQKLCDEDLMSMEYYTFKKVMLGGVSVIFSITGYTGAGGCEIYAANEDSEKLWKAVFEAGEEFGIKPIGLGWITKFNDVKGDFIDRDYMLAQKKDGLKRKLVGFELIDRGVPRHGYVVCDAEGNEIGVVTSGTMSPSMKKPIGMAYVATAFSKADSEIFIKVRDRLLKAKVVKVPFYKAQ